MIGLPADHRKSGEVAAEFISAALATRDPGCVAHAVGVIARAGGMTEIARWTRPSRGKLYRPLSGAGNPALRMTLTVPQAVGIQLQATGSQASRERTVSRLTREPVQNRRLFRSFGADASRGLPAHGRLD